MTDTVSARFYFKPDRAAEFLDTAGQTVSQIECVDIHEVMEYVIQFDDALEEACALVDGQVISLREESDLS